MTIWGHPHPHVAQAHGQLRILRQRPRSALQAGDCHGKRVTQPVISCSQRDNNLARGSAFAQRSCRHCVQAFGLKVA